MGSDQVLSPACGRVLEIASSKGDPGIEDGLKRVSIFLSLWDDHVTRSPIDGRIETVRYTAGKFGVALLKKNLLKNENNLIWISDGSIRLAVRQVAGRLARRIVCDCASGDDVRKGQAIGRIKLGSCVQLYLPERSDVAVKLGQQVTAGKTAMAYLR